MCVYSGLVEAPLSTESFGSQETFLKKELNKNGKGWEVQ